MTEKLQKVLARVGLGSRREIERWIANGQVNVDGKIAVLGDRVALTAKIAVDGKPISLLADANATTVLLYHKPEGEMCTRLDPEGRPTVFDHLPLLPSGRWVMVGRLDFNTSGLLLFTNNGELANQWMHPSSHLQRVYAVRVFGVVNAAMLQNLQQGVMLEDGMARFDSIEAMKDGNRNSWYKVSIAEGRNRIVRRLWESQHVQVSRLIRLQFGSLTLPRELAAGSYQFLSASDLAEMV